MQPVIHPDDARSLSRPRPPGSTLLPPVVGGATRQASVRAGLEALAPHAPDIVLVHDAARPFASAGPDRARDRGRARDAAPRSRCCRSPTPSRRVDAAGTSPARSTARRCGPCRRRRPSPSRRCSTRIGAPRRPGREDFTDDAALAEWAGLDGRDVRGRGRQREAHHRRRFRARRGGAARRACATCAPATASTCMPSATAIMSCSAACASRTTRGLSGHSDADVVLHALVDAILGALADGDIGVHFPPSDPQWRGASSDRFLAFAVERVRARGGRIAHLDVTIVCEAPRIGPHRDAMRARIAEIAGIAARARRRQGDHQREAGLHRPRRRHRGVRHRDRAPALERADDRPRS